MSSSPPVVEPGVEAAGRPGPEPGQGARVDRRGFAGREAGEEAPGSRPSEGHGACRFHDACAPVVLWQTRRPPPRKRRGAPPRGGTVAKVAAPQPEPRRTCLDEPGHWARGCLGVVSELALRRGTARARHREGRCRRPWRAVLATLPSTAVAAACFRARLAGEPSPADERAAREFRPPGGAGKTGTTDPAQPERTSRMVAHYLARGHRRARHRTRRRRPGPGRPPTLVVCPLNKLTLDLRGVSTVRAGIAVRRPVRPRASNRKIISGTYH